MHPLLSNILISSLIISIIASFWLIFILWMNPRIFLHDYPPGIQAKVPPKHEEEKKLSIWLGIPFILFLIIAPFFSTLAVRVQLGKQFWILWLSASGVFFIFNLVDWLILDWLIFCTITPAFLVIPGSEGMPEYKDYRFHFIGFLKGTLISIIIGFLIAGVIWFL